MRRLCGLVMRFVMRLVKSPGVEPSWGFASFRYAVGYAKLVMRLMRWLAMRKHRA